MLFAIAFQTLADVLSGGQCGQADPLSAWDAFAQEQRSLLSTSLPLSLSLSLFVSLSLSPRNWI